MQLQGCNGKRWISYNVNFRMGRDKFIVIQIFITEIDWIYYNAILLR